jgi:hypothetical protein
MSSQSYIVLESRASTYLDVPSDKAMVADANVLVEFRAGIHDGGMGYDRGHTNQLSGI